VDTDRDGVLDRGGRPFRFTLLINAGNQRRQDASQILQAQWKRLGVDARIQPLETGTFFDRQFSKNYEAALTGWGVGLDPSLTELWSRASAINTVSYDDPRTEALFTRAASETTEERAAPIWREAASRIAAARPYTWLFYFDQVGGANRRLRGMHVDTYGAYQNAWEWWIPKEYQAGPTTGAR
jgi:peptide/nickel transport system substrate-binding protein